MRRYVTACGLQGLQKNEKQGTQEPYETIF